MHTVPNREALPETPGFPPLHRAGEPTLAGKEIHKRSLKEKIGAALAALVFTVGTIHQFDEATTQARYPDTPATVSIAPEFEHQATHVEAIAFGGVGQAEPIGLPDSLGQLGGAPIVKVKYPSSTFSIKDLVEPLVEHFEERDVDEAVLIGQSTGLPIGLETFESARQYVADQQKQGKLLDFKLPKIKYVFGLSSPSSFGDALMSDTGKFLLWLSDVTGYKGSSFGKLAYASADSPYDRENLKRILAQDPAVLHRLFQYTHDTINQGFDLGKYNECSPLTVISQVQILRTYNFLDSYMKYKNIMSPTTRFAYLAAETAQRDTTVYEPNAWRNYRQGFEGGLQLRSDFRAVPGAGHADGRLSAQAIEAYLAEKEVQQKSGAGGIPKVA